MPVKKKPTPIFKSDEDLDKFVRATIADCATIGAVMERAGERVTQEVVDGALAMAYSRVRLIMGDQARRFANGETEDILAELTEQEIADYERDCLKFADKVLTEKGGANAEEGEQPEVPDKTGTGDAETH